MKYEKTQLHRYGTRFWHRTYQGYDPSYDQYPYMPSRWPLVLQDIRNGLKHSVAVFQLQKEDKENYTSKYLLLLGKNVIYDRLARDFRDNKIFRELPLIPPEWQQEFNLEIILKDDPIHVIPEDVLFLTNIQQLEERENKKEEVEEYIDGVLALQEVKRDNINQKNRIKEILISCPNIVILKDEAHHIYNFERAWKRILLKLHNDLKSNYAMGINMELDFTATPKTETGALFPWIIVDFPLKEAIEMNIVKLPLKGIVRNANEISSDKAAERYKAWIDAGIKRWREYKEALQPLSKKPILFIQCPKNEDGDNVFLI